MLSLIPNDCNHHHGELDMSVNLGLPFFNEDMQSLQVKSACINGIVCLYGGVCNTDIVLWNPAMREFKVVPSCPIDYPPYADYSFEGLGFGYDAKTKDYKVVRMVYFWEVHGPDYPQLIQVYSLNSNAWKKIDTVLEAMPWSCSEMYLNGTYHWLACKSILAFDMSHEVFRWMALPDLGNLRDVRTKKSFNVLDSCIAVIVHVVDGVEKSFDIWVMCEYGVEESWTKQFKIGPISGVDRPLGFGNNDNLLLVDHKGKVVSCDSNTHEIKNLNIRGVPLSLQVINYVPSLVSVQRKN
jgi:F-box interacting protein